MPAVRASLVLAAAACGLAGCGAGPSGPGSPASSGALASSGSSTSSGLPGASLPHGTPIYSAATEVFINDLFADLGSIWAVFNDSASASLINVATTQPVFTTSLFGAVPGKDLKPLGVVEASGKAFYVSRGALHEVALAGGTDQVIGNPGDCVLMVADASSVFCTKGGQLLSFPAGSGSPPGDAGPADSAAEPGATPSGTAVLDMSPTTIGDAFADATTVYVTAGDSGFGKTQVWSAPRSGGTPQVLATATGQEMGFFFVAGQADPANVYLVIAGGIARMSKATHAVQDVFHGPAGYGLGSSTFYRNYFYYGTAGTISRVPLSWATAPTGIAAGEVGTESLAVADSGIYWVDFSRAAKVEVIDQVPLQP